MLCRSEYMTPNNRQDRNTSNLWFAENMQKGTAPLCLRQIRFIMMNWASAEEERFIFS